MKIENIYLGTWMPRASMHLKEIYHFLGGTKMPVSGLDAKKLAQLLSRLEIKEVNFIGGNTIDLVMASGKKADITVSEEGTAILSLKKGEAISSPEQGLRLLEKFFIEKFSPSLKYLFSLGAPLPKALVKIQEVYPAIIVVKDCLPRELEEFIKKERIAIYSKNVSPKLDFFFGEKINILHIKDESINIQEILLDTIFLKEFPEQLKNYLTIHRLIWEEIDHIREAKTIAYKDFSKRRKQINDFLKTLSLMKARLQQMGDVIETKEKIKKGVILEGLDTLNMNRINNLIGDVKYIEDLWEMTIDYTKDTLNLIESLSQENVQRELGALKFITLISAITSFFGMNIAFPWDEQWPVIFKSSFAVVGIIILVSIAFYYFLKIFIYNRKFKITN
ncbi:MAG: hypothetical protein A3C50_03945 [Candidatus Staskawiczbacteria bacterium RIFCSPHIGHO2_02_FULL_43_16]|uniref:Uncharacterized protein n=1 Tax=Candidatus Staskawiczbacteria bacterium RIFCSPHIGHO2_01_FULL_41_41 TaxID=1802203 RepID=A0A1G2HSP9_9BACT|nr:MAG: hypothetical protein A2822_03830 [Candidatus Staskawiczbacteria bacterium RIFCSPHIGHO2_01_FULL_41_41]OGZ68084.1 MAG: hypothetical protein A3C50_03945 [Candidatus Staskawiczbacteria bacterium RIFCSPHIGHO2_02_FULL_43_16]OGZ74822.1 MAG: hypothetical protein A3A12_03135 [Candidatus Staskawiczbacteria bacterium RIFCSPLOWO2_01_FULL_43_17b]